MNKYIVILLMSFVSSLGAQTPDNLYGIVAKNYYSTVQDDLDSNNTFERFDSATIRLGFTNPTTGFVNNIGDQVYTQPINLTGAALNPYNNTFICMGYLNINTFDVTTGEMVNQVAINNPIEPSFFDNFRFCHADRTIYGLARRNRTDSTGFVTGGEVYLGKIDTQTGLITQISPESVAYGYALAGSAIDPYQMIYYFSTGARLMGLDLYNGSVYSTVPIQVVDGIGFDNFAYSCADTTLYGLIRQNYFRYVFDPILQDTLSIIDSSTIKLGKIDPNTGIVTTISSRSLMQGGYSLNGGAAVDPSTLTYFFSTGRDIVGVSLVTGEITSNVQTAYEDGQYFNLMRNFENCYVASALRSAPSTTNVVDDFNQSALVISPNPSSDVVSLSSSAIINKLSLYSLEGSLLLEQNVSSKKATVDMNSLPVGVYLLNVLDENNRIYTKKIVRN